MWNQSHISPACISLLQQPQASRKVAYDAPCVKDTSFTLLYSYIVLWIPSLLTSSTATKESGACTAMAIVPSSFGLGSLQYIIIYIIIGWPGNKVVRLTVTVIIFIWGLDPLCQPHSWPTLYIYDCTCRTLVGSEINWDCMVPWLVLTAN